jgi:hypothetical protein
VQERLYPVDETTPGRDLGADRDRRKRPCCARLEGGGWCTEDDDHRGDHANKHWRDA